MKDFTNFIEEVALIDIGMANAQFTWSNLRADLTCSRLDRFLVLVDWENHYPHLQMSSSEISIRSQILTLAYQSYSLRSRSFRFERFWFRGADFLDTVRNAWNA